METQSIHCKVTYNDQFRRFLFVGNEFVTLKNQIRSVLVLDPQLDFILKYKDNEGDLITISSDEELNCGRSFSQDLLRLTVVLPTDTHPAPPPVDPTTLPWRHCGRGRGRGRGRNRYYYDAMETDDLDHDQDHAHPHAHPYRHHGRGRGRGGRWGEGGYDMMKARLISKRDYLKTDIEQLTQPESAHIRAKLQIKLDRIESRLENMSAADTGNAYGDKMYKKWHKKEKKMAKHAHKHGGGNMDDSYGAAGETGCGGYHEPDCDYSDYVRTHQTRQLSEETLSQIAALKLTLLPFKLTLKTTKNEMKLRKYMLKEAKSQGKKEDYAQQLEKEIQNLKILKNETITKMDPIKQQIRQLKFGSTTAVASNTNTNTTTTDADKK